MGRGALDITAGPSQAVTLMRDTWMSCGVQEQYRCRATVSHGGEATASANAALHGGYESENVNRESV